MNEDTYVLEVIELDWQRPGFINPSQDTEDVNAWLCDNANYWCWEWTSSHGTSLLPTSIILDTETALMFRLKFNV